ncbi:hypothetical protein [Planomicrobium sp. CPCC 101079]|uniref:hypothetical protein n=1 Tax=Planomicrobium sp. CPCC 101079 TaxID=2599618 RepID=UPI0011B4E5EF|nr:hypothetical protein [Planomicrobium sp. CPCC 101079]TWT12485.1 hypothetical protein FQV28_03500 [Planomicrobium sp. CPCC 101079]
MPRKRLIGLVLFAAAMLAGCMATPEERAADGLAHAREAFEQEPMDTNERADDRELYLPGGYTIEKPSDNNNVIITKGSDSFVLFINPNEASDSKFFYDLQKANPDQQWLVDETFEQNGRFGFTTVRMIAEDRYEVVESMGGVKMTTISEESAIADNMDWMMKTVRSINIEE